MNIKRQSTLRRASYIATHYNIPIKDAMNISIHITGYPYGSTMQEHINNYLKKINK